MLVLYFFFPKKKKKTFKVELVYLGLAPPILLICKSSSFVLVQLHRTKENIGWQVFHERICNVCELHLNAHVLRGRGPFCKQYLGAAGLACRGKKTKTLTSRQLNTPVLRDFGICALRKSCQGTYRVFLLLEELTCQCGCQLSLPRTNREDDVHQKTSRDLQAIPDVVKGLCLVDHDAARRASVAVEEVLHDAAFTNWQRQTQFQELIRHL